MIYPKDDRLKAVTYEPNTTWKLINNIYTQIGTKR